MKNKKFIILSILFAFLLPYTYGGCVVVISSGDTDNDKKKNHDDPAGGFVGITSQAAISSTNAESLAGGAFAAGLTGVEPKVSELNHGSGTTRIDAFRPLRLPAVLGDCLHRIEFNRLSIIFSQSNIISESGNLEGSCGGRFSYTIKLDKISEKYKGRLSFDDYCDQGITISGKADVDGIYEVAKANFLLANFSFENLTDGYLSFDGELSIDFSDSPILATLTSHSRDNLTGQIYWIKNYSMNITQLAGYVEIEIFGKFYHPDFGFVNLTTTDPFVVYDKDVWPTSGQLVIQGDNHTQAQLLAVDHLRCAVEAVTQGNGVFDWDSGILNWTDL